MRFEINNWLYDFRRSDKNSKELKEFMPIETRAQAAKMEEQVKQMMAMLAEMKKEMSARMEKMGASNKEKGKKMDARMEKMNATIEEMKEKLDARNKEMDEKMDAR